jgi:hypothetical protein
MRFANENMHPEDQIGVPARDANAAQVGLNLIHKIEKQPAVELFTQSCGNAESAQKRGEHVHAQRVPALE